MFAHQKEQTVPQSAAKEFRPSQMKPVFQNNCLHESAPNPVVCVWGELSGGTEGQWRSGPWNSLNRFGKWMYRGRLQTHVKLWKLITSSFLWSLAILKMATQDDLFMPNLLSCFEPGFVEVWLCAIPRGMCYLRGRIGKKRWQIPMLQC